MGGMSDDLFPPDTPAAFLTLCVGEWMSLRSLFALSGGDDDWHTSERGELKVENSSGQGDHIGHLQVSSASGVVNSLHFATDGCLTIQSDALQQQGRWRFWPDGSLELNLPQADGGLVQERIWFTRANLRLRSTTALDADGQPLEGSFCTDIRRVSKPVS